METRQISSVRNVYHVECVEGRLWQVKEEATSNVSNAYTLKEEAIEEAVRLARMKPNARVIIHDERGAVVSEQMVENKV